MSIPRGVKASFNTLVRACKNGHLALMECKDAETKEPRYVICAVSYEGGEFNFSPFGHMVGDRNPYEAYIPPEDPGANALNQE